MPGTLPVVELECIDGPRRPGCGNRWPSTGAPGRTIRCPRCGKGRRMPKGRPLTAAQAVPRSADDGLTALWASEGPPARWRDCLGVEVGQDCRACGSAMRWTGAHTAVVCPSCEPAKWSISPGARERVEAHAAALDKRANRTAAAVADPTAERARRLEVDRAAIELARLKGAMLRQLAALTADNRLDPESLPIVEWFDHEARAARTEERLEELADLLPGAGIRRRHWWQGSPEALDHDDDDHDDDDQSAPEISARTQLALPPGNSIPVELAGTIISGVYVYRPCRRCREAGRVDINGHDPSATLYADLGAGAPPIDLCDQCYATLRQIVSFDPSHGPVQVIERYAAGAPVPAGMSRRAAGTNSRGGW